MKTFSFVFLPSSNLENGNEYGSETSVFIFISLLENVLGFKRAREIVRKIGFTSFSSDSLVLLDVGIDFLLTSPKLMVMAE